MKHNTIEFKTGSGLMRLEAVLPGVIRCAHTLEAAVQPPLLAGEPERPEGLGDFFEIEESEGRIALRSGALRAVFDRASES